ncbi:MAG: Hpt domain-containing protein [Bacteroidota bacterium]
MMTSITDLSYLKEIASGDDDFISEVIQTFIHQVPKFTGNMRKYLKSGEYLRLAKEAHTAKSSVIIFGMNGLAIKLKELQLLAENQHKTETYPEYIDEFEQLCKQAIKELKSL